MSKEARLHRLLQHAAFARSLARALTRDAGVADDVVQQAWMAALRKGPRTGRLRSWLGSVVRNLARKRYREEAARARRERIAARGEAQPSAAARAARAELLTAVTAAVCALEPAARDLVLERFYEDRPPREIAARLGVPVETVRTRLKRVVARLRRSLDSRYGSRAWVAGLLWMADGWRSPGGVAASSSGGVAPAAVLKAGGWIMAGKIGLVAVGVVVGIGGTLALQAGSDTRPVSRTVHVPEAPDDGERRPVGTRPVRDPDGTPATQGTGSATRGRTPAARAEAFLERINAGELWQVAYAAGQDIVKLPPKEGLAIMRAIYGRIRGVEKRKAILKPFAFEAHPHVLEILDLGVQTQEPAVQDWAWEYVGWFTFRDFKGDLPAYDTWKARIAGQPLALVVERHVREYVQRMRQKPLNEALADLRWAPPFAVERTTSLSLAAPLRDAGFLDLAQALLERPLPRDAAARAAALAHFENLWRWVGSSRPEEAFARRVILPILDGNRESDDGAHLAGAAKALGRLPDEWAFQALVSRLRSPLGRKHAMSFGVALAGRGDRRAIPHLIAAINAHDEPGVRAGLGWFGLNRLTGRGVDRLKKWEEPLDGDAWLAWWDRNKTQLPAEVQALDPRRLR